MQESEENFQNSEKPELTGEDKEIMSEINKLESAEREHVAARIGREFDDIVSYYESERNKIKEILVYLSKYLDRNREIVSEAMAMPDFLEHMNSTPNFNTYIKNNIEQFIINFKHEKDLESSELNLGSFLNFLQGKHDEFSFLLNPGPPGPEENSETL
jgi:hypothetical protein